VIPSIATVQGWSAAPVEGGPIGKAVDIHPPGWDGSPVHAPVVSPDQDPSADVARTP
jgi:hypothetical protein